MRVKSKVDIKHIKVQVQLSPYSIHHFLLHHILLFLIFPLSVSFLLNGSNTVISFGRRGSLFRFRSCANRQLWKHCQKSSPFRRCVPEQQNPRHGSSLLEGHGLQLQARWLLYCWFKRAPNYYPRWEQRHSSEAEQDSYHSRWWRKCAARSLLGGYGKALHFTSTVLPTLVGTTCRQS